MGTRSLSGAGTGPQRAPASLRCRDTHADTQQQVAALVAGRRADALEQGVRVPVDGRALVDGPRGDEADHGPRAAPDPAVPARNPARTSLSDTTPPDMPDLASPWRQPAGCGPVPGAQTRGTRSADRPSRTTRPRRMSMAGRTIRRASGGLGVATHGGARRGLGSERAGAGEHHVLVVGAGDRGRRSTSSTRLSRPSTSSTSTRATATPSTPRSRRRWKRTRMSRMRSRSSSSICRRSSRAASWPTWPSSGPRTWRPSSCPGPSHRSRRVTRSMRTPRTPDP